MSARVYSVLSWLVTLLLPVLLLLLGVRLLLMPGYPSLAYNMPGFPEDSYGFTKQDRLYWSRFAIDYLLNDAGLDYLGELKFPDGSPLYNERELSHMLDVKVLVQKVLQVLYLLIFLVIGLGLWAYYGGWWGQYRRGVWRGGWLTVWLIVGVGAFAAVSFWQFFTYFHTLFFTGDSWLFNYSDTLIRLFPMRFWQDVFMFGLGFAVLSGLSIGFFMKPKSG